MSDTHTPGPSAFVSYSWDSQDHRLWVAGFAARLRADGIDVKLDLWHAAPGDQLPEFMERSIRENDFVLVICTPAYKKKSDERSGGVGYEGDIMTGEVLVRQTHRKFIPILRSGSWPAAAPSWLIGKYFVDMRETLSAFEADRTYDDLVRTLRGERPDAPELGTRLAVPPAGRAPFDLGKDSDDLGQFYDLGGKNVRK